MAALARGEPLTPALSRKGRGSRTASMRVTPAGAARTLGLAGSPDAAKRPGGPPPEMEKPAMNLLEDPGRFHWKWIAITAGLLILYAIERTIRTGGLF